MSGNCRDVKGLRGRWCDVAGYFARFLKRENLRNIAVFGVIFADELRKFTALKLNR